MCSVLQARSEDFLPVPGIPTLGHFLFPVNALPLELDLVVVMHVVSVYNSFNDLRASDLHFSFARYASHAMAIMRECDNIRAAVHLYRGISSNQALLT